MKKKLLAILNAIFLWGTLLVNYLATSLPIAWRTTWELSDLYPNLFVPAWFTFSIWWIIYLLLLGFVIRQLIDAWKKKSLWITERIGPWFIVSCIANMGWLFAWHNLKIWLSVLVMFLILASLIMISLKIKTRNETKKGISWKEKIFLQVPFWVYLGWISVATIANISTYLISIGRNMFGMSDIFWTIIVIFVATLLWIIALYRDANIPYSLVILRAFFGIIMKRIDVDPVYASSIIWTLGICSVLLSWILGWRIEKWIKE